MNFSFTDEQIMIRESAQTFLADACSSEAVRAAMQMPLGFDPAVWQSIAQDLGWCGLSVPEACDGLGLGPVELVLVQEQAGYRLLPAPFFSNVCLATTLLLECASNDTQAQWLSRSASGELRLSADLPSSTAAWANTQVLAMQKDGAWYLSGELPRVPDAQQVDALVVIARTDNGLGLFVLDAASIECEPLAGWDSSRRFSRIQLQDVPAQRGDADCLETGLRRAAALLRLYLAAEQLGCALRCLDITLDYVMERKQFGRAVGSFQAVKHRCAEMMFACESTRSAVTGAAAVAVSTVDLDALEVETAAARALATESLQYCAGEAIQLHGGVGFTWEYDPQLFFKRAQASSHWLGNPSELRGLIAAQLLD